MAEPTDLIPPMLRGMRAENPREHQQTREQSARFESRMAKLEEAQKSFRQAPSADSLFSKLVTGEFEDRIVALERKVREIELQQ